MASLRNVCITGGFCLVTILTTISVILNRSQYKYILLHNMQFMKVDNITKIHTQGRNVIESVFSKWPCLRPNVANCPQLYIGMPMNGRLGNFLFTFAATIGMGFHYNATPILDGSGMISDIFKTSLKSSSDKPKGPKWIIMKELKAHKFHERALNVNLSGRHFYLRGYFQSWKYFSDPSVRQVIRHELQFKDEFLRPAKTFLKEAGKNFSRTVRDNPHFVGVHVRRGDMVQNHNGYVPAPASYILKAMAYFEARHKNLIFVVCTDAPSWVRSILRNHTARVVISERHSAAVDLAILSLCRDTIMTVGSYGWWGAWLAGGQTLYYGGYPQPGSLIDLIFSAEDYFAKDWIALN